MGWTRAPRGASLSNADGSDPATELFCGETFASDGTAKAPKDVAAIVCCKNRRRVLRKGVESIRGERFIRSKRESQEASGPTHNKDQNEYTTRWEVFGEEYVSNAGTRRWVEWF